MITRVPTLFNHRIKTSPLGGKMGTTKITRPRRNQNASCNGLRFARYANPSLPSVMRLVRLWFGRFFCRLFLRLDPFGVKYARFVDALIGVRAEEIALRLQEIRRQPGGAVTIEIR